MEKIVVSSSGVRLDQYLLGEYTERTRSYFKKLIEMGNVTVNGKVVKSGYMLKIGDEVEVDFVEKRDYSAKPEDIDIDIVYEDDDLAVINKPQGMVVHPAVGNENGTMVNALLFKLKHLSDINGEFRPGIVHRLDKDTSGLLVVAKNDKAHLSLSEQIANKTCKRIYLAVVDGYMPNSSGVIETYIGRDHRNRLKQAVVSQEHGKLATTLYTVVHEYKGYSLVQFELKTGRTHQIRVHSEHIGHPIVGDSLYNPHKCEFKLDGQLLVAKEIQFIHPRTKEKMSFSIELPDYFSSVLNRLKEKEF